MTLKRIDIHFPLFGKFVGKHPENGKVAIFGEIKLSFRQSAPAVFAGNYTETINEQK
jgi:hypothetical protein